MATVNDHVPLTIWQGGERFITQVWQLWRDSVTGYYQLRAKSSGKCLSVENGSIDEGAPIEQLGCSTASFRKWIIAPRGRPKYRGPVLSLMGQNSNKCLDIASQSRGNGAGAQQNECVELVNSQRFYAEPDSLGSTT